MVGGAIMAEHQEVPAEMLSWQPALFQGKAVMCLVMLVICTTEWRINSGST
jgi:hypothetical protein